MNSSALLPLDLSQFHLNQKIQRFLSYLPTENHEQKQPLFQSVFGWPVKGLCHGYSLLMLRADMLGEIDCYLERLRRLAKYDDQRLWTLALAWISYQANFVEAVKTLAPEREAALIACEDDPLRRVVRRRFFEKARQQAIAGLVTADTFAIAEDLYRYIHALLTAQMPSVDLSYQSSSPMLSAQSGLSQHHLTDILARLQQDEVAGEALTPGQVRLRYVLRTQPVPWSFGFTLSRQELIVVLDKILFVGDYGIILGNNHDVYVSRQKDGYRLGESNDPRVLETVATTEALADKLIFDLYHRFGEKPDWMAFGFLILETWPNPRPRSVALMQLILSLRGEDKHLDALSTDQFTALNMAAFVGCHAVVCALLELKADATIPIHTRDAANQLHRVSVASLAAQRGLVKVVEVFLAFNIKLPADIVTLDGLRQQAENSRQYGVLATLSQHQTALAFIYSEKIDWGLAQRFKIEHGMPPDELLEKADNVFLNASIVYAVREAKRGEMTRLHELLRMGPYHRRLIIYYLARFEPQAWFIPLVCDYSENDPNEQAANAMMWVLAKPYPLDPVSVDTILMQYADQFTQLQLQKIVTHLWRLGGLNQVEWLLRRRKDIYVNACDLQADQQTWLHDAAESSSLTLLILLCERGANVAIENQDGHTVLSLVCKEMYYPHLRCVMANYLLDHYPDQWSCQQRLLALRCLCLAIAIPVDPVLAATSKAAYQALMKRLVNPAMLALTDLAFLTSLRGDFLHQRAIAVPLIQAFIDQATSAAQVLSIIQKLDAQRAGLGYLYERRSKVMLKRYRYDHADVSPKWLELVEYAQKAMASLMAKSEQEASAEEMMFMRIPTRVGLLGQPETVVSARFVAEKPEEKAPLLGRKK